MRNSLECKGKGWHLALAAHTVAPLLPLRAKRSHSSLGSHAVTSKCVYVPLSGTGALATIGNTGPRACARPRC